MIEVRNISKTYKTKKGVKTLALDNVSFNLPDKGLFFILGKSGSGKSTLLNILGGLDSYDSGDMIVDSKSTKKFKGKDFDYYRNTYIGFIFQEFNLLEEYNVYDNIILSRKLQKEKVAQEKLDDLLNKVGIAGLGKRRINELSGGQKGRVAIARALIKNPEIILADEPTGNLDEETGRQIFSLLKSISREKLVIVVSHDRDSASYYADGILEIADGHIIANTIPEFLEENKKFKSKKSRLPFLSSLKFAFANLSSHKVKLFFTILLVFMSVVFFGASKILSKFNINKSHAETMAENHNEYITLKKETYDRFNRTWINGSDFVPFEEEDIEEVTKQLTSPYKQKYLLNENNEFVSLDIDYKNFFGSKDFSFYYAAVPNYLRFIEADKEFINQKIIGKYPENSDEIMIHSYFADYIMKAGIALYEENPNQFKKEYYKPTSYEDFLEDKYYKLGSTKVKITGILMDNTEPFDYLKDMPYQEGMGSLSSTWLGLTVNDKTNGFSEVIGIPGLDIYVAPGFVLNVGLKPNTEIDASNYSVKIDNGTTSSYISGATYGYLKDKIDVFDGEKTVTIQKLGENELIVPESYLDAVSKREYSKLKEEYIKKYNDEVRKTEMDNKNIREENKKLEEEYQKKLETDEDAIEPIYKEEKEIVYKDDEELNKEFLKNYLKENISLENEVSLVISSDEEGVGATISNLKIIGFVPDGDYVYIPSEVGNQFMKKNYIVNNLVIHEKEANEIEKILCDFPTDNSKFMSNTTYSNSINSVSGALNSFATLAQYASYIFGFFAFILLTNFIVTSIYYNKKTIGILRGLGARTG